MKMFDTLHTDTCSICGQDSELLGEGVQGMFGAIPVTFCELCLASIVAMVHDLSKGEEDDDMCI